MKLPPGVTFHWQARIYVEGDEIPPELEAKLPGELRTQPDVAAARPQAKAKEK